MAKKQFIKVLSPIGTAAYAWISKPDEGHKYSDGKFKVTLIMDPNDPGVTEGLAALEEKIQQAAIAEWGKVPKNLNNPLKDGDDIADEKEGKDELRGMTLLTAKSKFQPGMVNAKREELPEDVYVRSGDTIRLSAVLIPYVAAGNKGVAIQLRNVQLLEQRESQGGGANDFDEVDGYETEFEATPNQQSKPTAQKEEEHDDDPDDF